jgi:hypothetical protein
MTVIETLCLAGDLILHGTAQATAHQDGVTHGSSSRASTDRFFDNGFLGLNTIVNAQWDL